MTSIRSWGRASARALEDRSDSEWREGWPTLLAGFVGVGVTWIFFQITAGVFIRPMQAEFGWRRAEISIGPITAIGTALLLPVGGRLIDRYGPRPIAIIGLATLSAGFLIMSAVPASRPLYYAALVCLAGAGAIANSVVFARGVAPYFRRHFGAAIGLMMTGSAVSVAIGLPAIANVISHWGWRAGFLALAGATAGMGLPVVVCFFRERPLARGPVGLISTRHSGFFRQPAFWMLCAAAGAASLPIGGYVSQLQPMLAERGLSVREAAHFGVIFAVTIGLSRVFVGALLDRLYAPAVTAVTLLLSGAGAILLVLGGGSERHLLPVIGAAVALIGLAEGAEAEYYQFFTRRLFDIEHFGRVVSVVAMVISLGMAIGGIGFAWLYDVTGSYSLCVDISAALYVVSAGLFAILPMRAPPIDTLQAITN